MPQKKLLIFGGTGASGVHTVNHALSEGHEVIVYARNPDKLPEETRSNPKLKVSSHILKQKSYGIGFFAKNDKQSN